MSERLSTDMSDRKIWQKQRQQIWQKICHKKVKSFVTKNVKTHCSYHLEMDVNKNNAHIKLPHPNFVLTQQQHRPLHDWIAQGPKGVKRKIDDVRHDLTDSRIHFYVYGEVEELDTQIQFNVDDEVEDSKRNMRARRSPLLGRRKRSMRIAPIYTAEMRRLFSRQPI